MGKMENRNKLPYDSQPTQSEEMYCNKDMPWLTIHSYKNDYIIH